MDITVGTANKSPLLDTRVYTVQLPNSNVEEYTANEIACNIYANMDEERHEFRLLDRIVSHRKLATSPDLDVHSKLNVESTKKLGVAHSMERWDYIMGAPLGH